MDPRRRALQETLDLLRQEGWAPSEPDAGRWDFVAQSRSQFSRWFSLIIFACVISVTLNVVLIAALHDSREPASGVRASLVLLSLKEMTFIEGATLYLTVDGMEVWRRSSNEVAPFGFKETKPVEFTSQCVVQLWRDHVATSGKDKLPEIISQSIVMADQAEEKPIEVNLMVADGSHYRLLARVTKLRALSSR